MIIIITVVGWTLIVPLCVVVGLLCASTLSRRRARRTGATDMAPFEPQFSTVLHNDSRGPANEVSQSVSAGY